MDKKGIIALALCAIILMVYFPIILPKISPPPKKQETTESDDIGKDINQDQSFVEESSIQSEESFTPTIESSASENQSITDQLGNVEVTLQDHIVLQNDNIISVWTNEGASLKSVVLKNYKDSTKKREMELIRPVVKDHLPLSITNLKFLTNEGNTEISLKNRRFRVVRNTKNKAIFETTLQNGLQIRKNISLDSGANHLNVEFVFVNKSDKNITCEYQLVASSGIVYEGDARVDIGTVVGIDKGNGSYKLIKTNIKDLPERNESVGISWSGSVNKYFAAVLKPVSNNWINAIDSQAVSVKEGLADDFMVKVQTKPATISPSNEIKHSYLYYLGPKLEKLLTDYSLESLLGFGMFKAISKILLKILNGSYNVIPNYGVSILFLTLLVKLMLFPLTRKSQMSMFKMQNLQPEIEKLKAKFKNDKQRMAKAQMQLFKEHGANPLGGCLPMVLQLPIFFALFRTLQLSFEMRQAPFVFWINDLSMPDTLITLPFTIPVLGNMLNILPLIMTGASFVQMKLNPKSPSADPQARMQQKMMSFMPFMFCFILYKMPSGLTLYWTTSTLFSIGENLFIRKSIKKIKKRTIYASKS